MPVHHIDVEPVGSCLLRLSDLLAQAPKAGSEDGRGNFHAMFLHMSPIDC